MNRACTELSSQRRALLQAAAGSLVLLAVPRALARLPLLTGREQDAITLEFTPDASSLDPATRPSFQPGSRCAGCYFFQGKGRDDVAPCTVFAGWRVPAAGWCSQFTPRS